MSQSCSSKDLQKHARESAQAIVGTINRLVGSFVETGRRGRAKYQENSNFSEVLRN
ncbi:hypothetical protein [Mycoplasma wenyonii]|uniref:hypothetical protein n=1 Tax=Mycoplasma wenyonii TaxID=65123 RepID=UPI00030A328D|nr:hypothetical protein [Mycoplasma wenyonii]